MVTELCLLKNDAGGCGNYAPRWYFEPVTGVCRRFLYGGCGGNANRFATAEACWVRCGDSQVHSASTLTPRPTSTLVHQQPHGLPHIIIVVVIIDIFKVA